MKKKSNLFVSFEEKDDVEQKDEVDLRLKQMLDERINSLREDFQEDLNRTKLSMQMNFILHLEKLRVRSIRIEKFPFENSLVFFLFFISFRMI